MTMRIVAIDHGTKRMGIAVSDELGMLAHPLEYVEAEPLAGALKRIEDLVVEKQAGLVLVGMPRNMDGSYGPAAAKVNEFVAELRKTISVPVKTWDERLTSVQANRFMREANVRQRDRKGRADQMAAAILLQSYLDSAQL